MSDLENQIRNMAVAEHTPRIRRAVNDAFALVDKIITNEHFSISIAVNEAKERVFIALIARVANEAMTSIASELYAKTQPETSASMAIFGRTKSRVRTKKAKD